MVGIPLLKLEIPNVKVFVRSFDPMKLDWYRATEVEFSLATFAYE